MADLAHEAENAFIDALTTEGIYTIPRKVRDILQSKAMAERDRQLRGDAVADYALRILDLCRAVEDNPTGWGGPMVVSFARTIVDALDTNPHRADTAKRPCNQALPPESTAAGWCPEHGWEHKNDLYLRDGAD